MTLFLAGQRLRLDDRDLVGEGGEGRVYRHGALAVKVFTAPNAARAAKLKAFPAGLPGSVVAPLAHVLDDGGDINGYSMNLVERAVDLARFSNRRWRTGRATNNDVLKLIRALAGTVAELHARNVVVGDLNDGNVVVTDTKTPWFIDADSMQLANHACVVAHERFLDPRFYGRDLALGGVFSPETDWYALAVMAFSSLLFVHPFGGAQSDHPTLLRRAEARHSALRGDVKLAATAARPDILPDDVLHFFERVFEKDLRSPLPPVVLDARFTTCACGAEHARSRCPQCTLRANVAPVVRSAGKLKATRVFYKLGARVIAASYDGTLRWVAECDGVLRREDETVVAKTEPFELIRIAGNATWLGSLSSVKKVVASRVVDSQSVSTVHGSPAADADIEGLVYLQGDVLWRAAHGTRIGQVLEGQTHVRVSPALGFAFYRAGGLSVAFLFDPRKGPLRQIEGFPALKGRLQDWSAVFGDDHALVTFALELNGKVTHLAVLVDANGRLKATDQSVLPPSCSGRAVGPKGTVIAATDNGLMLARPDGGDLTSIRLFPEAKDFVSPADDLLVGSGGSLYAVTDDEITHLCFTT
jgi:hypothetical protein